MEILRMLPKKTNVKRTAANGQKLAARPRNIRATGYRVATAISTFLLPKRLTRNPAKGMLTIKPTGKEKRTAPRPASVSASFVLISGIRLAHEAKLNPA